MKQSTQMEKRNDPNVNFGMYQLDRVAKAKAQPSLPAVTDSGKAPRAAEEIEINVHRLGGDEHGFEVSTRHIKNGRGLYFCNSGDTRAEALESLAMDIADDSGWDVTTIQNLFVVKFEA